MYRLICYACGEEHFYKNYEEADEEFTKHSQQGHRVDLVRIDEE